jgi:hypothetical protein
MGLTKRDLEKKKANMRSRITELEAKARMDPLKKNRTLHEELAELKKKVAEY